MRHLTAVRVDLDGGKSGWHYASLSRRGGHPVGYCAEHDPHPTEEEARECYGRYQRDQIKLDGKTSNWSGCAVCDAPTKNLASSGAYRIAALCDEHLTTEHAAEAMHIDGPAGESWES